MPDVPLAAGTELPSLLLRELQRQFADRPPTLPAMFQAGDRLSAADPVREPGLGVQRVAVLGAATVDYLSRAIACAVALEGVFPVVYQAPFGVYVQEALDPASGLSRFAPELAVIAPEAGGLGDALPPDAGEADVAAAVAAKVALFERIWDALAARGCRVVQHLLPPPPPRYRGVAERMLPGSPVNVARALNEALLRAGRGRVQWVDLERLAAEAGGAAWSPGRYWYSARLGFNQKCLAAYLPAFRGAWRAATGRARKVLALDLDNTLWGGVIGDDGVEGIVLGAGSPDGEAFADWQAYVKALAARGVVLAVCSKNAPAIAESGLAHPASVLARADFAAFECSWSDKAGGLRRIAATLNLGLDSIVFADDNPAECALVRRALPEVAVVDLGDDPAAFIERLDQGHWFDAAGLTGEDLRRSEAYAARAAAEAGMAEATDLVSYLAGLGMRGRLARPEEAEIARVAQLEMKTNQFNVMTRRYPEAAIRDFLARPDVVVLAFRLADRFGDHGLASTLIAVAEGDALRIDSWLMSCRIFSRTAEQFIMRALVEEARARGLSRIVGEYAATPKNGVVAELYPRLGFDALRPGSAWSRDVAAATGDLVTHVAAAPG